MTAINRRWLLLVHQLPAKPSNLRVQTWRRLQQLGAIPVKQAVYALPDTPEAREDFEWLKAEITGGGGEATVFVADNVDAWSDEALVEEFKRTREAAYKDLARDIQDASARLRSTRKPRGRGVRRPDRCRLLSVTPLERGRRLDRSWFPGLCMGCSGLADPRGDLCDRVCHSLRRMGSRQGAPQLSRNRFGRSSSGVCRHHRIVRFRRLGERGRGAAGSTDA